MPYEQVETILKHVRQVHRRASGIYAELAKRCEKPRVTMLLDYMSRHEEELADAVQQSAEDAERGVLQTWIQLSSSSQSLLDAPELTGLPSSAELTTEELIEVATQVDGRVIAMYEDLADRSDPEHVQALFEGLLEEERQEERLMVRQSLRGDDL